MQIILSSIYVDFFI